MGLGCVPSGKHAFGSPSLSLICFELQLLTTNFEEQRNAGNTEVIHTCITPHVVIFWVRW